MPSSNNIVLGAGTVWLHATIGSALPADTVAKGGAWGGSWVDLGYTGGVSASISDERHHVEVDQSTMEVRSFITKQAASVSVTLKEATLANLKYALGHGSLSTTGSTAVLTLGDNASLSEYSIGVEGQSPNASAAFRRVQLYRCVGEPDVELAFSREEEQMYTATFKALLHTSGSAGDNVMQIRDYTA